MIVRFAQLFECRLARAADVRVTRVAHHVVGPGVRLDGDGTRRAEKAVGRVFAEPRLKIVLTEGGFLSNVIGARRRLVRCTRDPVMIVHVTGGAHGGGTLGAPEADAVISRGRRPVDRRTVGRRAVMVLPGVRLHQTLDGRAMPARLRFG